MIASHIFPLIVFVAVIGGSLSDPECGENQEWKDCGAYYCEDTCYGVVKHLSCRGMINFTCKPGCFCKPGYAITSLNYGDCITYDECSNLVFID
ncbi:mucin-5B-like isoform X2 [Hermetia illucens]|uniref:mucin-5B-like isoform X2 n=1 Tax=Hermetia illucens TaxID=343691 RepID=UPI0018CC1EAA|nr:mucin-5B-like isoform X2 [Hermetia illucens]